MFSGSDWLSSSYIKARFLNAFSLTVWVKLTSVSVSQTICGCWDVSFPNSIFLLIVISGVPNFAINGNNAQQLLAASTTLNASNVGVRCGDLRRDGQN